MIAAATRRNRPAMEGGRVRLMAAALTEADLEGQPFDVVVSFNVRAFWTSPAPEWNVVDRVLAPGGRAVVAWSLMGAEMQAPVEEAVGRLAGARDLVEAGLHRGRTAPTESVALELRRGI
jgi:SAM-dependent methyltransferase